MWDGDQILFEIRNAGGAVTASTLENDRPTGIEHGSVLYTHGHKLDQPLDVIRMGHSSGTQQWGGPYPVHPIPDWRGSFIDATNWEGRQLSCGNGACDIVWPRYSAFYVRQPATQTTFFGSLIWGKEDASGLNYMRNRYYNPQTGAFTQADPIGLAGGLNTYGFANGDPVSYSDPYGLSAVCDPPKTYCPRPSPADMENVAKRTGEKLQPWDPVLKAGTAYVMGMSMIAGGGGSAAATRLGITGAASRSRQVTTLYRAVGQAEFDDIVANGAFRAAQGQYEGKLFATSFSDALQWGQSFYRGETFHIVTTQVSTGTLGKMDFLRRVDGIGPAYHAGKEMLQNLVVGGLQTITR